MIYTLFVWTAVTAQANMSANYQVIVRDWRPIAQVEPANPREAFEDQLLAKCAGIARELGIPRDRYRCIRTK